MKTFILDILPRIKEYSQKLSHSATLTRNQWVSLSGLPHSKVVFIFRERKEILFSTDGIVEKGSWEYLNSDSIFIEKNKTSYLFKHGFLDDKVLVLSLDGSDGYTVFVNEKIYGININDIEDVEKYLSEKYFQTKKNEDAKQSTKPKTVTPPKAIITPNYSETEQVELHDFFNGKHYRIEIKFEDGFRSAILLGGKSKKYFLEYGLNGIQYFENKKECIDYLYRQLYISQKEI